MTETVRQIMQQVGQLSDEERGELLELLFAMIQAQSDEPIPEWHRTILDERIREMDSKPDDRIPADQVYEKALKKLTTPQS